MLVEIGTDTLRVTLRGHTWVTGAKPPKIDGWRPKWVSHFGQDRTEITYTREA